MKINLSEKSPIQFHLISDQENHSKPYDNGFFRLIKNIS